MCKLRNHLVGHLVHVASLVTRQKKPFLVKGCPQAYVRAGQPASLVNSSCAMTHSHTDVYRQTYVWYITVVNQDVWTNSFTPGSVSKWLNGHSICVFRYMHA